MRQTLIVMALSITSGFLMHLRAQQTVPLVTGPLSAQDKTVSLETEVISVGRLAAWPNSITRHTGKFILILRSQGADPKAIFTVEAATAVNSTQVATPLQSFDFTLSKRGLLGAAINPPVGQYQLKSATGQVLFTLTID